MVESAKERSVSIETGSSPAFKDSYSIEKGRNAAKKVKIWEYQNFLVKVDGQVETFKALAARLNVPEDEWSKLRTRINYLRKTGKDLTTDLITGKVTVGRPKGNPHTLYVESGYLDVIQNSKPGEVLSFPIEHRDDRKYRALISNAARKFFGRGSFTTNIVNGVIYMNRLTGENEGK